MAITNGGLLTTISQDRALASAMLFPHRHPQESPPFHIQILDAWGAKDEFVLIEAFREGAKSTLAEESILTEACFGNFGYCILLGETYTKACQRLEAIKHEAVKNMKLHALFGRIKCSGRIWNENQIELMNGVMIEAHGWEEELRGFKWHDLRPDRAYLDDIENRSMVKDKTSVDNTMKKLYLELMPAMDKVKGKIRVTGTPLAEDCMISRLRSDQSWTTFHFPICNGDMDDPKTVALWPERYPMEWVRQKRDEYERAGQLRGFLQEYMLQAIGTADKPFEEEHIREIALDPAPWLPKTVIIDPARTANIRSSDRTGRVVVSRMGTKIYVHESSGEYWKPDQIIEDAFGSSRKYSEAQVAIEKNSLDEWLLQPMRAEMLRRGITLPLKAISAPQDRSKEAFIMGLQPFFQAGDIVLVGGRGQHSQLISEILNFPAGKRDILNALAYTQRVFSGQPVYEEFFQHHLVDGYEPSQRDPLAIAFNATPTETTAALLSVEGERIVVIADWISPLTPAQAVPDIVQLVKAAFPQGRVRAWAPGEVLDNRDRLPLGAAMQNSNLIPQRGAYVSMSRGSLSPLMRTELKGRRLFLVDSQARHTMNALAGGYNFLVSKDGRSLPEPEKSPHRTLIEGIESAVAAISSFGSEALPEGVSSAINPQGATYLTSLPRRR